MREKQVWKAIGFRIVTNSVMSASLRRAEAKVVSPHRRLLREYLSLWTRLAKALVSLPRNSCSLGEYRPELAGWK